MKKIIFKKAEEKILLNKIMSIRRNVIYQMKFGKKFKYLHNKNEKVYICANSAVHGNLGDQALGFCRLEMLHSMGINDANIIEFTSRDEMRFWPQICKTIKKSDTILLRGGGWWGNIWLDGFTNILKYIEEFKNNKIVVFPQSVYFSDDEEGRKWLKYSQKIVTNAHNLFIVARDRASEELLKKYYSNTKIICTPDTVLSYSPKSMKFSKRSGVLLCLRNDKEKLQNESLSEDLKNILKKNNILYFFQDTNIEYNMKRISERKQILYNIWQKFSSAKLVITDRLHGMIFATITGTPCLVFNNIDGKVEHQYEWIKDLKYVKFINPVDDLEKEILTMISMSQTYEYNIEKLSPLYKKLILILASED